VRKFDRNRDIYTSMDNSKDLKVVVGVERRLQGSRRRNVVPPPTIEEVHESGTRVLMKVKPLAMSIK